MRKREEASIIIDRSIFETAAENAKEDKRQEARQEEAEDTDVRKVDYLTPFLQNVSDVKKITREQGMKAREACLRALKERLLERANIIQTRLDEENSLLAKKAGGVPALAARPRPRGRRGVRAFLQRNYVPHPNPR